MKPRTGFVPSTTAVPSNPPPLHHCAGQRKGRSPACGLPAATVSGAPPRQRLRHWLCHPCYRRPASADFLALPSLGACCPPPAPSASLTAPSATSTPACSLRSSLQRPLRGKCSAALRIQHNSLLRKVGPVAAPASLGVPTAARPAGSRKCSYVLRPYTANSVILALRVGSFSAARQVAYANRGAALARLPARSLWPAPPAVSW